MYKNISERGVASGVFYSWARWVGESLFGISLFVCLCVFACVFPDRYVVSRVGIPDRYLGSPAAFLIVTWSHPECS